MSIWKLLYRTSRSFFDRDSLFHVQFSPTSRCNLRCHYCHIWEEQTEELDTEKWKVIVDKIDAMGAASVAFTGGEPMLRDDICGIIDYAKLKGLFVKLTSNGTLPIERYRRLLETGIDNISISLDGIEGDDLPYRKVSPKIIELIKYLYLHREPKQLYISHTLTQRNREGLAKFVSFLDSNFPGLPALVQPVVVGQGKLRRNTEGKVDASILKEFRQLLNPESFSDACQTYYSSTEDFQWGCNAGRRFFHIRPNGDFWICQDVPTELNILDDDFFQKWESYDFTPLTRSCGGCIYNCYLITQKAFEPRYWPDLINKYILLNPGRQTGWEEAVTQEPLD